MKMRDLHNYCYEIKNDIKPRWGDDITASFEARNGNWIVIWNYFDVGIRKEYQKIFQKRKQEHLINTYLDFQKRKIYQKIK